MSQEASQRQRVRSVAPYSILVASAAVAAVTNGLVGLLFSLQSVLPVE